MAYRRYAEQTQVPSDRSRVEIERILRRYGADSFVYGWDREQAAVGFRADGRQVKFMLPLPNREKFYLTPTGRSRSTSQVEAEFEKAIRQRWRALCLVIKAKLEAVVSGITTFEEEFLAHIVLPDGTTVGQFMLPQVQSIYETGRMPPLLPGAKGGSA